MPSTLSSFNFAPFCHHLIQGGPSSILASICGSYIVYHHLHQENQSVCEPVQRYPVGLSHYTDGGWSIGWTTIVP